MATIKKISGLSATTTLTSDDYILVEDATSGVLNRTTIGDLKSVYLPLSGGAMTGPLCTRINTGPAINFREHSDYRATLNFDTQGNEALAINFKYSFASFMVNHGVDGNTWTAANKWTTVTPSLQVKDKSVAINSLITASTADYNLYVNGSTSLNGTVKIAEKVTLQYNSSTESLDFVFA